MPIYEFQCRGCGHEFEELVLSRSAVPPCPSCGKSDCEKLLSGFSMGPSGGTMDLYGGGGSSSSSSCGSCHASSCAGCGSR